METKAGLTKEELAALRHGHNICVHLHKDAPTGLVRVIHRMSYADRQRNPFLDDKDYVLKSATVSLCGYRGDTEIANGTAKCFAMCGIYHGQRSHVSSIIKTLRVGDELKFRFYPDAHSNGYCAMSGLHADLLQLDVYRGGKHVACWDLITSTCPENSARMCRGFPVSESYRESAREARKIA